MELPENIKLYVDRFGMLKAKIEYPLTQCEDCGQMCKNRVTEYKMHTNPMLHWRHQCKICKLWEHPDSEKFCLTSTEIKQYYKEKKIALKQQKDK